MGNSPYSMGSMPNHRAAVQKAGPVREMKSHDGDAIADILNEQILGLNVHIRRRRSSTPNLFEDRFEGVLEFCSSVGPRGNCARIEHGGIVLERQTECVPIEIVEGGYEPR